MAKIFSPAKVNLFLAITGVRPDNYHNILAVNHFLTFGDEIEIVLNDKPKDEIICKNMTFNCAENTILQALDLFRQATSITEFYKVHLQKNIPAMAGFGGGSSNAVSVLQFLNEHHNNILSRELLHTLAIQIGADCPCFLYDRPVMVTGLGECVQSMPNSFAQALKNYSVYLFKPHFNISTLHAYNRLRTKYQHLYLSTQQAKNRLDDLQRAIEQQEIVLPLYNTFAEMLFLEHPDWKIMCNELKTRGINIMLSGSGSGFFCLVHRSIDPSVGIEKIRSTFGRDILFIPTNFVCVNSRNM